MKESNNKLEHIKERYRELLTNLSGVFAANVDIGEDGNIREIHILAGKNRNPKQIARDVQSALSSAFDIRIDHRIISIAQIPSDPMPKSEQDETVTIKDTVSRFSINGIWQDIQNGQYTVKVSLQYGDQEYEGTNTAANTAAQRMRAAALATLNAIHSYLGTQDMFILLAVERLRIAGSSVAVTAIDCTDLCPTSMLVGSAVYTYDEANAVIRSTLSAINRKLPFMVIETS